MIRSDFPMPTEFHHDENHKSPRERLDDWFSRVDALIAANQEHASTTV